jgi:hypothetical protein
MTAMPRPPAAAMADVVLLMFRSEEVTGACVAGSHGALQGPQTPLATQYSAGHEGDLQPCTATGLLPEAHTPASRTWPPWFATHSTVRTAYPGTSLPHGAEQGPQSEVCPGNQIHTVATTLSMQSDIIAHRGLDAEQLHANMQTCKHANMQTCKHANMQTCKHANMQSTRWVSKVVLCHPTFHDPTSAAILPRDAVVEDGLAGVETAGVALTLALVLDEIVGLGLVDAASLLADVGEGGRDPKSDNDTDADTDADTDVKADGDHLELGLTLALALEDVEVLCVVDATPGTTVLLACV